MPCDNLRPGRWHRDQLQRLWHCRGYLYQQRSLQLIHNSTEYNGASSSLDVGLESRIGVQAVVTFDSHWSVTAQEEAKLRGTKNFDPGTEWLFVQYQPYSDLKVRVGRVVMPSFLYSDVINVGYAMPWFRTRREGAVPTGGVFARTAHCSGRDQ